MGIVFGTPEANRIAREIKALERVEKEESEREIAKQEGRIKRFRVYAEYRVNWMIEIDATDRPDAEKVFLAQAETADLLDAFDTVALDQPDFITITEIR